MVLYDSKFECKSTSLDTIYYNDNERELYVLFLNGSLAGYKDVPRSIYDAFVFATSPGKYYNIAIRGQYKGVSVHSIDPRPRHLTPVPSQDASAKTGASVPMVAVGNDTRVIYGDTERRSYTVRGYVFAEDTYEASSMEEAVEMFLVDYEEGVVKEVVVSFE